MNVYGRRTHPPDCYENGTKYGLPVRVYREPTHFVAEVFGFMACSALLIALTPFLILSHLRGKYRGR
jgi:hypothetical protein